MRVSVRRFDSASRPETRLCSSRSVAIHLPLAVIVVSCESLVSSSVRDSLPPVNSVRKACTGRRAWPMPRRSSVRLVGAKRWVHSLLRRTSELPVVAWVNAWSYGGGVTPTLCVSVPWRSERKS